MSAHVEKYQGSDESLVSLCLFQERELQPGNLAVLSVFLPKNGEGLIIEGGDGRYRLDHTEEGIVFSSLIDGRRSHASPRYAQYTTETGVDAVDLPWADAASQDSYVLPPNELLPVNRGTETIMKVVAAPDNSIVSVVTPQGSAPLRVFMPIEVGSKFSHQ